MTRVGTNSQPLRISAYTLSSAAGDGRAQTLTSLRERRSGLTPNDFGTAPFATWIGRSQDSKNNLSRRNSPTGTAATIVSPGADSLPTTFSALLVPQPDATGPIA